MRYDEDKIAKILDSIKEKDLDYSPLTWNKWGRIFMMNKVKDIDNTIYETVQEYREKYRLFEKSDLSEKSFKKIFTNSTYDKFIHLNEIDPDLKTINLQTKQRISLELTEVAKDLTYTQIFAFVDLFFDVHNVSKWTPEYFASELSGKYPRLRNYFIGDEIKSDKAS